MMERADLAIVGAGPAGCAAAVTAARAGLDVVLIEASAWPRDKVCGCCVSAAGAGLLERLGVVGELGPDAAPLRRLVLLADGRRAEVALPAGGFAVSRRRLDAALAAEAARHSARFCSGMRVARIESRGDGALLSVVNGGEERAIEARMVLIAAGLAPGIEGLAPELVSIAGEGARMGLGAVVPAGSALVSGVARGEVRMHVHARGYLGIVGVEGGVASAAAAVDHAFVRARGGAVGALEEILRASDPGSRGGVAELRWRGTPWLTRRAPSLEAAGVLLIGDAAGYVEPFTGEGITWGLASGIAAAAYAGEVLRGECPAGGWTARARRLLGARQRACGVIASALRRPAVVRAAMGAAGLSPGVAALVPRFIGRGMRGALARAGAGA